MFHLNDSAICFFPWIEYTLQVFSSCIHDRSLIFYFFFYSSISERGGTRGAGSVVACGHATYIGYIWVIYDIVIGANLRQFILKSHFRLTRTSHQLSILCIFHFKIIYMSICYGCVSTLWRSAVWYHEVRIYILLRVDHIWKWCYYVVNTFCERFEVIWFDIAWVWMFLVLFLTYGEVWSNVGYKMINIELREGLRLGKYIGDMANECGKISGWLNEYYLRD